MPISSSGRNRPARSRRSRGTGGASSFVEGAPGAQYGLRMIRYSCGPGAVEPNASLSTLLVQRSAVHLVAWYARRVCSYC